MIATLLTALLLSQMPPPPSCWDCVQVSKTGPFPIARARINLTLTITSDHMASFDVERVHPEVHDVYRLAVQERVTGTPDAFTYTDKFLILDDFRVLQSKKIELAFLGDGQINIALPDMVAIYRYPAGKTDEEVFAMLEDRKQLEVYTYVAHKQ